MELMRITVFLPLILAASEKSRILVKKYLRASGVVGGNTGSASPCRFRSQLSLGLSGYLSVAATV